MSYGAASSLAAAYYSVDVDMITLLAALFMIMYIPVTYHASKAIDVLGLRNGVGIGVILNAIGGLMKAVAGPSYWVCFSGQVVAAAGQPFVLNSWTKLSTNWFPEQEKTTATGLASISQFFGVIIAMVFPIDDLGIYITLWFYAFIGLVQMIIYLVFIRDKPATPPNAYAVKERSHSFGQGVKEILAHNKEFLILFSILFIGYGMFNALTTEIGLVFAQTVYNGLDSGILGALVIAGGVAGAIVISAISDRYRKRKVFIFIAFLVGSPLVALLFIFRDPVVIYALSFSLGFVMVSCMPVGLTYAAEITYPHPEETSAGILMVSGQVSGLLFLLINPAEFLMWFVFLFIAGFMMGLFIHDTPWHEARRKPV